MVGRIIENEPHNLLFLIIVTVLIALAIYVFRFLWVFVLYPYFYLLQFIAGDSYMYLTENETNFNVIDFDNYNSVIGTTISGVVIGLKTCIMIFVFI